jgi:hypothetical protein
MGRREIIFVVVVSGKTSFRLVVGVGFCETHLVRRRVSFVEYDPNNPSWLGWGLGWGLGRSLGRSLGWSLGRSLGWSLGWGHSRSIGWILGWSLGWSLGQGLGWRLVRGLGGRLVQGLGWRLGWRLVRRLVRGLVRDHARGLGWGLGRYTRSISRRGQQQSGHHGKEGRKFAQVHGTLLLFRLCRVDNTFAVD